MVDFLDYSTSILNPLFKLIAPLIFLLGCYFFYNARQKLDGELRRVSTLLLISGLTGTFAMAFRYAGDVLSLQWKWGESIFFLLFAVVTLVTGYMMMNLLASFRRS